MLTWFIDVISSVVYIKALEFYVQYVQNTSIAVAPLQSDGITHNITQIINKSIYKAYN